MAILDNHQNHQLAAELHDLAAHAHRTAAEQSGKQDHLTGAQRSRQALEHSSQAHDYSTITAGHTAAHGVTSFGHDEISARAHEIWLARGGVAGSPEADWYQAAAELRSRATHS